MIINQKCLLSQFIESTIISEPHSSYVKGDSTTQQLLYLVITMRSASASAKIIHGLFLDVSAAVECLAAVVQWQSVMQP